MLTYIHTRVNSAHTHGIDKEVVCGNQIPKNLKHPSSTSSIINKLAPRLAESWVVWRAVASLAARWSCLLVQTIICWASMGQLHLAVSSINVSSLLGASWRANQRGMLVNKPCCTAGPPRTYCGAHGEELEQRGMEATLGTNSTKAVTRKTRPPLKA